MTLQDGAASTAYYSEAPRKSDIMMSFTTYHPDNRGFTNTGRGNISAKTNLKNTMIFADTWDNKVFKARTGDGEILYFQKDTSKGFPISQITGEIVNKYSISKREKPNGNCLHYEYKEKKLRSIVTKGNPPNILTKVTSTNSEGEVFGDLKLIRPCDEEFEKKLRFEIEANDGRKASYQFVRRDFMGEKGVYLTHVDRPNSPWVNYEYMDVPHSHVCKVKCKSRPLGRYIQTEYFEKGVHQVGNFEIRINKLEDARMYRVKLQKEPVGTDQSPHITHQFLYDIKDNTHITRTLAFDAYLHQTIYYYDNNQRLTQIEKYTGTGPYQLYQREKFIWHDSGNDLGNLAAKILEDGQGKIICAKTFQYDAGGNVLKENFFGNLSGQGGSIAVNAQGIPVENGSEVHSKAFTYNNNAFRTVESESEGATTVRYTYVTGKNLIKSKFICEGNQIKMREFYDYDNNGILIDTIRDDGCSRDINDMAGITERHHTKIKPTTEMPIGLPEVIEELYYDHSTKQENLLSKKINTYTREGLIATQAIYDSQNRYCYTLEWEYNAYGNVIREKDSLGNTMTRDYDENGNLIAEYFPRGNSKHYEYDFCDRLIKEQEIDIDGTILETKHHYDFLSNRTKTINPFGQETQFLYDDFGRLVKTIFPQTTDQNGVLSSSEQQKAYNTLGYPVETIDGRGYKTKTAFNVRGQPVRIDYPDGSNETFLYNIDGTLKYKTAKNGTTTHFAYDYLKRSILEDVYAADGTPLRSISNRYNAFHLISKTDPEGIETTYRYDGAGRLIAETRGHKTIQYQYDALGNRNRVQTSESATIYEFDFKGQLLEERLEGLDGKVFRKTNYQYDVDGNQIRIIQDNSTTYTQYNARKQPVKIVDSEGNETIISYDYHYRNPFGQIVLKKTVTDPLGTMTHTIYDTMGREVCIEKQNPYGILISQSENSYDQNNQLVKSIHFVFSNAAVVNQISTLWEYNGSGNVVHVTEAAGTPEQKQTRYHYNEVGQKETLLKPDGGTLGYEYDPLERLCRIYSSDHTIDYTYTYNRLDQPTLVYDQINDRVTERAYDDQGNLIKEILANGLILESEYDIEGRPKTLTLPDGSVCSYIYDAAYLREVCYQGKTHRYLDYDQRGNLLRAQLCGEAGQIEYAYDSLNRLKKINSIHFNEENLEYDRAGNLVHYVQSPNKVSTFTYDDYYQIKDENGLVKHQYTHDSLNNRLSKDAIPHTHNSLNQLLSQSDTEYQYDLNGNLIIIKNGNKTTKCTYDALDRLKTVSIEDLLISYTYDSFNRRLTKTVEENVYASLTDYFYGIKSKQKQEERKYIYQGQCEIGSYEKYTLQELRILGLGKGAEIGATVLEYLLGNWYVPIHDHNGNVSVLIDAETGNLFETYRYSAFGEEVIYDDWDYDILESINPWRFSSKRKDPHTHWIAFGRRDYDAGIGRWITPDPQGFEDGPNLYAYVHNNPLTHIDLWGLAAQNGNWVWRNHQWMNRRSLERNQHRHGFNPLAAIGQFLSLGKHLPIPFARRAVDIVGRFLQGYGLKFHNEDYTPSHTNFAIIHPNQPDHIVGISNGQNTPEREAQDQTMLLFNMFKTSTFMHYNSTYGFGIDTIHTVLLKLGFVDRRVINWVKHITEQVNALSPKGKYLEICWSGGAEVAYQGLKFLSSKIKSQLYIVTLGGARMITDKKLSGYQNFVDIKDPIPFIADPIGVFKGYLNGDVKLLNSNRCFGFGHDFKNPVYQEQLNDLAGSINIK